MGKTSLITFEERGLVFVVVLRRFFLLFFLKRSTKVPGILEFHVIR